MLIARRPAARRGPPAVALAAALLAGALLAGSPAAAAGEGSGKSATERLVELQAKQAARREALIEDATRSADRDVRRSAVAQLLGGYAGDPAMTARLLAVLADATGGGSEAGERGGARAALSPEARINALFLLSESEDAAWEPALVARAARVRSGYARAGLDAGPEEREAFAAFSDRIAALSGTTSYYGEVQPHGDKNTGYTDLDVFVCEGAADEAAFVRSARAFADGLKEREFGRIRLREGSDALFESVGAKPGQATLVFDAGHAEAGDAERLEAMIAESDLPRPALAPNEGAPSYWYLSLFLCP